VELTILLNKKQLQMLAKTFWKIF